MKFNKGKIWFITRFFSLISFISIFIISFFVNKNLKLIILFFYVISLLIISKVKKTINLLIRIIIISFSILFFKFFTLIVSYKFSEINFLLELNLILNQILNISNSIIFSFIFFKLFPFQNILKLDKFDMILETIKEVTKNNFKNKKIKITNISSFFSYLIYESYLIFYK